MGFCSQTLIFLLIPGSLIRTCRSTLIMSSFSRCQFNEPSNDKIAAPPPRSFPSHAFRRSNYRLLNRETCREKPTSANTHLIEPRDIPSHFVLAIGAYNQLQYVLLRTCRYAPNETKTRKTRLSINVRSQIHFPGHILDNVEGELRNSSQIKSKRSGSDITAVRAIPLSSLTR